MNDGPRCGAFGQDVPRGTSADFRMSSVRMPRAGHFFSGPFFSPSFGVFPQSRSFAASSSLAGGRISTALKDTPVAYSVLTAEFLDAFNITNIAEAAQWTVKCTGALNGPAATGQHCPEGWTLYDLPGPNYKGAVDSASADSAYYDFVDRFDLLGVGKDIPLATGNGSEALVALVDGKFMSFRVPYPMGFYAKGIDGRIDDPRAGWKGKGIWTTFATRAPFHVEGGKGNTSKLVKFQVRPDPLAK